MSSPTRVLLGLPSISSFNFVLFDIFKIDLIE